MLVAIVFLAVLQASSLVNAAFTPRNIQARHAALRHAARAPAPLDIPLQPLKKRDSKKCRARPSSTSIAPSSSPVAPVNAGNDPSPAPPAPSPTHKQVNTPPPAPSPTEHPHKPSPTTSAHHDKPTDSPSPPSGGNSGGGGGSPFGSFLSGTQTGQSMSSFLQFITHFFSFLLSHLLRPRSHRLWHFILRL